jgi:hypothetical protein
MRGKMETILRWVAAIAAVFKKPTEDFSRPQAFATNHTAGTESGEPITTVTSTIDVNAKADQTNQVNPIASIPPDQQGIQRRRELVRTLFNDFWNGSDEKPAAFVDRLDQAEEYLNDRLVACGESWQLDAKTRKVLGLPTGPNSRNQGNGGARPI